MPVQINELVIRANVVEPGGTGKQPDQKSPAQANGNNANIVKECVELVLEILHNKNQR